jgi:hypothetical protein
MGFRSFVLPRLTVTPEEIEELRATAALLEAEVVSQYEAFVTLQKRRIDRSKWKLLRSDGDLHTYQESHQLIDELGFMSEAQRPSVALEPQASLATDSTVGRVLVTGTIPGTVDDALYGCSFTDTVSLRTQEAYQRQFLNDCAVLYAIDGPTLQDPFRFLGITWHVRDSRLLKTRECLLLQRTHLATMSTGERIGISLRHSIQHRDLPESHDKSLARVVLSSVSIFHQQSVGTVDVFGIELLDDRRRLPDTVVRLEAAKDLLTNLSACDSGHKKKLHRLMRQRHLKRRLLQGFRSEGSASAVQETCELCSKSTKRLLKSSGVCCQLCSQVRYFRILYHHYSSDSNWLLVLSTARVLTLYDDPRDCDRRRNRRCRGQTVRVLH